jgi:hypothetical protein
LIFRFGRLLGFQLLRFWHFWQSWQCLLMSRDAGDLGDSSFSRLPDDSITKSVLALPAILPSVIPSAAGASATAREEPRGCLPRPCIVREFSLETPLCSFVSFVVKTFDFPISALTSDNCDHGDSSSLSFRALPEHTRGQERNPEDVCPAHAPSGHSLK